MTKKKGFIQRFAPIGYSPKKLTKKAAAADE